MMVQCGASSLHEPGRTPVIKGNHTMTIRTFVLATLAIVPALGSAVADERIDFIPPLYREQARPTATIRPASELTTTPSLVRAAPQAPRRVSEATAR